jgi:hypothetical protein
MTTFDDARLAHIPPHVGEPAGRRGEFSAGRR